MDGGLGPLAMAFRPWEKNCHPDESPSGFTRIHLCLVRFGRLSGQFSSIFINSHQFSSIFINFHVLEKDYSTMHGIYSLCLASSAVGNLRRTTGAVASGNGRNSIAGMQHRASVLPMNSPKTDHFEQQKYRTNWGMRHLN